MGWLGGLSINLSLLRLQVNAAFDVTLEHLRHGLRFSWCERWASALRISHLSGRSFTPTEPTALFPSLTARYNMNIYQPSDLSCVYMCTHRLQNLSGVVAISRHSHAFQVNFLKHPYSETWPEDALKRTAATDYPIPFTTHHVLWETAFLPH